MFDNSIHNIKNFISKIHFLHPFWIDIFFVSFFRLILSWWVSRNSYPAISDDDYSRVVIALQWKNDPSFDPSHSSWLPFPFWWMGIFCKIFGTGLHAARISAWISGVLSSLLLYSTAFQISSNRQASLFAALIASIFPWSAILGVATVPELLIASLCSFACASSTSTKGSQRILGALALLLACLSRYEAWTIAIGYIFFQGVDLFQMKKIAHVGRISFPKIFFLASILISAFGPVLWIVWNKWDHGSWFHFFDRVSNYRQALRSQVGLTRSFFGYFFATWRQIPALVILFLGSFFLAIFQRASKCVSFTFQRSIRPFFILLFQWIVLSITLMRDGAPTHHPERVLLTSFFLFSIFSSLTIYSLCMHSPSTALGDRRISLLKSKIFGQIRSKSTSTCHLFPFFYKPVTFILLGCILCFLSSIKLDNHFSFMNRQKEETLGMWLNQNLSKQNVLVDAAFGDYSYFAIEAAHGNPENFILDRDIDPRKPLLPSSFDSYDSLQKKVLKTNVFAVVSKNINKVKLYLGDPIYPVNGSNSGNVDSWFVWKIGERKQ